MHSSCCRNKNSLYKKESITTISLHSTIDSITLDEFVDTKQVEVATAAANTTMKRPCWKKERKMRILWFKGRFVNRSYHPIDKRRIRQNEQ